MLVEVICDNCGWSRENQMVKKWHKKECPVCGHQYIIDDHDMISFKCILIIKLVSDIYSFFCPWKKKHIVHINSAEFKPKPKGD